MPNVIDQRLIAGISVQADAIRHIHPRQYVTCTQLGNTATGTAAEGAQAGYVWFTDGSPRALGQALSNGRVNPYMVGVHVWIAERVQTHTLEVIDTDFGANVLAGGVSFATAGTAPPIPPDLTQVIIPGRNIFDRMVHAPDSDFAGLNVCVEAGLTPFSDQWRIREHDSVASYLPPTTGMRWWVKCYEDESGVHFSTSGSVETGMAMSDMLLDNGGSTTAAALENVLVPVGATPLAGIVLENGQTAVTVSTRIVDWRQHFAQFGTFAGWSMTHDVTIPAGQTWVIPGGVRTNGYTLVNYGVLVTI